MKIKLLFLLLLIPTITSSQITNNLEFKTISGFISHHNKKLPNVTVFVENTTRFSVSDTKGFYTIKAKVGETVSFSYIGLEKRTVFIEDVTSTLNINLKIKNSLSNLVYNTVPKLGESNIGENIPSFLVIKIDGKTLNKNASSLSKAIVEKFPYLFIRINHLGEEIVYLKGKELNGPVVWKIDDVIFDVPYPIFISEVKDVLIVNQDLKKTIITVHTNIDYKKIKNIDYRNYYFTNEEFYQNDALLYKRLITRIPFLDQYRNIFNTTKALNLYLKTYAEDNILVNYYLEIFNYFKKKRFDKTLLLKVLSDYEKLAFNNPEDLKVIAYKYQELNENEKALAIYKKIANLRPNYRQSFRDLANAYLDLQLYKKVRLIYHYFLQKGFTIEDNDIGEIISSEIISASNLEKENKNNLSKDVRLVFEWNTTEAEFILEFVNPNLEVYRIENSAERNLGLIIDQKKKGYTSKEIFIEKLQSGNYLVNFTYLGNKQNKATVLKITTYYNWGKPNQTKKIDVFDFIQQNVKTQLLKLNRKYL